MAKLGVAAGGAALGGVLGSVIPGVGTLLGAGIGWAVGGVAGALLFPDRAKGQNGPRLNDLTVQTSGYGVPIPVVAARAKLTGNVIWKTDIQERSTTRRQGKGGAPKTTTYSYYLSWAVGLCEWLTTPSSPAVLRIWLDANLVYDATNTGTVTQVPGFLWRWYPGSETQSPDPLIEAKLGTADAPAFRGLAYIVFEDVPLEKFGNRMPNVTVELAADTANTFPQVNSIPPTSPIWPSVPSAATYINTWPTNVAVDQHRGRIYEGRSRTTGATGIANDETIRVYDLLTMATIGEYPLGTMVSAFFPGSSPTLDSVGAGLMHLGLDGYLYVTGGIANRVPLWKIDPDTWRAVAVFGPPAGDGFGFGDNGTRLVNAMQIATVQVARAGGETRTLVVVQGSYSATLTLDAATMGYVWGASDVTVSPPAINPGLGIGPLTYPIVLVQGEQRGSSSDLWVFRSRDAVTPLRIEATRISYASTARNAGSGVGDGITSTDFGSIDILAVDASATYCLIQSAWRDDSDGTFVLTFAGAGGPFAGWSRFSTIKWSPTAGVIWSVVDHALPSRHDARGSMGRVLSGVWGLGGNFLIEPATGATEINAAGGDFNNLFWLDEQQAVIGYRAAATGPGEIGKRYLTRVSPNTLTVGQVVGALAQRAGLQVTDYNVSALTDSIRGYTLAQPMSARDAITVLAAAFQFDCAEVDDVLVFRNRGGASVATVAYAEIVREASDSGILEEQRAQDADLPRTVTCRFPDIERGWEQGSQSWRRPLAPTATMASRGDASMDLPIPLTAGEAKSIARIFCVATWRERTRLTFSVGPQHARLVPTDVILVGARDGASIRCRVLRVEDGANWVRRIEAVTEDAAVYGLTATADGGGFWDEPTMPLPYYTRLILPDLALVEDADDMGQAGLREYALACAYDGTRWRGVSLFRSADASVWDAIGTASAAVAWGAVIAMPAAPFSPWTWDEVGQLDVLMVDGAPESATDLEVLTWSNMAALVDPATGAAEVIQWRTATALGGEAYRLAGLLRGRRGTEDMIPGSKVGTLFVILDETRLAFSALASEVAATRYHRAASVFETVETATATATKTMRGRAEKPYAVVRLSASRDGSNNITLDWFRRTRVGGEWLDGTGEISISEASQAFEVDILAGAPARYSPTYDASSVFSGVTPASNAFDGDISTPPWASAISAGTAWLRVSYAVPIRIARYEVQARDDGFLVDTPADWTFEGWDGAAWIVLDTQSGQSGWSLAEIRGFTIASPVAYTQYRLNMTATNGSAVFSVESLILRMSANGPPVERVNEAAIRTITASTPTATYAAAQQTTDWGGTTAAVFVRVYQMSNIVGRGVAAELLA